MKQPNASKRELMSFQQVMTGASVARGRRLLVFCPMLLAAAHYF
jgi:hypothetical protein